MTTNKSNWKDYLDVTKILLGILTYLIVDMHQSFKHVIQDVEDLKIIVGKHEYILNLKQGSKNEKDKPNFITLEAVLPSHDKKYFKDDNKHKS